MPEDQYVLFPVEHSDYPLNAHRPMHPAFTRTGRVYKNGVSGEAHTVNLQLGECTCDFGKAWAWQTKPVAKWVPNAYCVHKLKVISAIVNEARGNGDHSLDWPYVQCLATRYNRFEVVSAFHKELRRGDDQAAIFWGGMLAAYRGLKSVHEYLCNITYEETRDHSFLTYILGIIAERKHTYADVCRSITFFCRSKKKWELLHRVPFFEAEMRGYQRLITEFGTDVAKAGDIIDAKHYNALMNALIEGVTKHHANPGSADWATLAQYGLKGLQKIKPPTNLSIVDVRENCFNRLIQVFGGKDNAPPHIRNMYRTVMTQRLPLMGIGYHELNAFVDMCLGESATAGVMSQTLRRAITLRPRPALYPLAYFPHIPLYAHDNHTWAGKAAINRFPHELDPGATQEHMDLRLCGAYMGVGWRYYAYAQHSSIDVPWSSVKWPRAIQQQVVNMFY